MDLGINFLPFSGHILQSSQTQRHTAVFALSKGAPGAVYIYRVQNLLAESIKVSVSEAVVEDGTAATAGCLDPDRISDDAMSVGDGSIGTEMGNIGTMTVATGQTVSLSDTSTFYYYLEKSLNVVDSVLRLWDVKVKGEPRIDVKIDGPFMDLKCLSLELLGDDVVPIFIGPANGFPLQKFLVAFLAKVGVCVTATHVLVSVVARDGAKILTLQSPVLIERCYQHGRYLAKTVSLCADNWPLIFFVSALKYVI